MTADEGSQVLEQVLSMTFLPQIAIAVADLPRRYEQWIKSQSRQPDLSNSFSNDSSEEASQKSLYARPNLSNAYTMPSNQIEQVISTIWQELLGVDQIGIHDNFFSLGGDSFLLVQAKQKLQTALSRSIPTIDLFEYPTIAALATYLSPAEANQVTASAAKTEKAPLKNVSDRASKQRAAMEQEANQRLNQQRRKDNG